MAKLSQQKRITTKGKTPKERKVIEQYRSEKKRIQQFLRRATKRGYIFNFEFPPIIGTPTKADVKTLKKITPKTLYKNAEYVAPETGEVIEAQIGLKQERSKAAKKGAVTKLAKKLALSQIVPIDYNQVVGADISELPYDEHEPVVDKWAEIGRRIAREFPENLVVLTEGKGKGLPAYIADVDALLNGLHDIWRNTDSEVDDRRALNRYVEEHEEEFAEALSSIAVYIEKDHIITKDSVLRTSVTKLANLLNFGKALTVKEAESLSTYGDYYGATDE